MSNEKTINISLSKALKLKNRLAGRLTQVKTDITRNNSVLEKNKDKYPIAKWVQLYQDLSEALIELKTAISKANLTIQEKLYTLGERKSDIAFYQSLNVRDGIESHDYQNTEVVYVAYVKDDGRKEIIRGLESQVDQLQDEIDEYNATTKIAVTSTTLDLGS